VFLPRSELVMVYGGALAPGAFSHERRAFRPRVRERLRRWLAIVLAGTIGYTIGSILGWAIGVYGGPAVPRAARRWFHLSHERLERAERWFDRWGDWAVLLGRVTPVARSFVSIPAGVFEVPFVRYNVLTLIGNSVWCFRASPRSAGRSARSWEQFTTTSASSTTRSRRESSCSWGI
jgi:hypothetical protein